VLPFPRSEFRVHLTVLGLAFRLSRPIFHPA
jgi:hypothetical protein